MEGGRLSENTTEVWWFGLATLDNGVAIIQSINVLLSACYTPSDEPDTSILGLIAERASLYSRESNSSDRAIESVFVFGCIHSNIKNRTIGSSFFPFYYQQFTLACRDRGVQNAIYIEYNRKEQESEESQFLTTDESPIDLIQLINAHVFDIARGVRYLSHVSMCYHPPQSTAERHAFVTEFLSHIEVRKDPQKNQCSEEELERLLSTLPRHQHRVLRGRTFNSQKDGMNELGWIDKEE
jgi:hypothetical protein